MDIIDRDNKNEFFDIADEVITVPKIEDIRIKDAELYMKRLAEIQTPRERLIEFFKSQFSLSYEPTHEASYVRLMGLSGLMFGWLFGGISRSRTMIENFQRQHNASIFDNDHRAKRLLVDNYVYTAIRRGAKFGVGSCLFCTSAGLIAFGSISYRNELYYPDWLLGFSTLGAVSRCWLGLRGLVFGTGMGLLGGTVAYGYAKFTEFSSGKSAAELRYLNHVDYLMKRESRLNRMHRIRSEVDQEKLSAIR